MSEPKFIHLNVHSDYSIIDGLAKIPELIKKAAFLNMPAIAITDVTNLFGLIKFYKNAQFYGIKPIIGADFFIPSDLEIDKFNKLTLLASNIKGYKNLIKLISLAYTKGYQKIVPNIKKKWLVKYRHGLIVLSGGRYGDIGNSLLLCKFNLTKEYICFYKKYFYNHFYIEIIRTRRQNEDKYLNNVINIAEDYQIPIVATNEVCFINYKDFEAHEIRLSINTGNTLYNKIFLNSNNQHSPEQYLKSEKEMCLLFSDLPESIANSVEIAKRCNITITLGNYFLPCFNTKKIKIEEFLIKKSKRGLNDRLLSIYPDEKIRKQKRYKYDDRLVNELNVINKMGFPSYFLIVMEFIQWSKKNNIPVGPGRGSGAGSLVAYCLKITDVDPLKFGLIFERFLNPERVSMPDFDIDFCMEKRDKVIDHVTETYGKDSVAQIITFGTMTARSVIRDVGRVLGYNYRFIDRIAKLIPLDYGITLKKAFTKELKLKELYESNEEVKTLINMALKLEGTIRNVGKHAGGVVISPTKITDFVPIYCDINSNNIVTQFDKNDIEYTGLVKFDFLGLKTLTIINNAVKMINKKIVKQNKPKVNISKISLNDKKIFNILNNAETTAIFQLESYGIKKLIKRLKPDSFEDIIALVALFRPGPLQSGMVDNYINRKHGKEEVFYPDKKWQHYLLKPVLKSTYGIILYQEQVMKIAQILAGYNLGEADILRRAMSKKNPKEMSNQKNKFEKGAKKLGIESNLAIKIFNLVENFAGYGFNKSHSTAYALVSYQTLWLKAHYPAEFMSSAMTADMDNIEKIVLLINECWRMGLKILKPDINESLYNFHVNKNNEIVYGLGAIKGIGKNTIDSIVESRKKIGNFSELFDLCTRIDIKNINKKVLENLILSGSCDCFTLNRAYMISMLSDMLKIFDQKKKFNISGQSEMFSINDIINKKIKKNDKKIKFWPNQIKLNKEKETLGLYFSDHPINEYIKELEKYSGIIRIQDIKKQKFNKIIKIAGLIKSKKTLTSKIRNKISEIIVLDDNNHHLEVILKKDLFTNNQDILINDSILIITGQFSYEYYKFIAHKISCIDKERKYYTKKLILSVIYEEIDFNIVDKIKNILEPYCKGKIPVYLIYKKKKLITKLKFGKEWQILPNICLINKLKMLLGTTKVKLEFH